MPSIPIKGAGAALASPPNRDPARGGERTHSRRLPILKSAPLNNVDVKRQARTLDAIERLEQAGFMAEVLSRLRNSFTDRLRRDIAEGRTNGAVERLLEAFDQEVSDIQDGAIDQNERVELPSLSRLREALSAQARMAISRSRISARLDQVAAILKQQGDLSRETPEELASILSEFEALTESMGLTATETARFLNSGRVQIALAAALALIERAPRTAVNAIMSGPLKAILPSPLRQNLYAAATSRVEEEEHRAKAFARRGEAAVDDVDALLVNPSLEDAQSLDAEPVRFVASARAFLSQPLDSQSAALRRKLAQTSQTQKQRSELVKQLRLHHRLRERLENQPLEAAALMGLEESPKPLDFTSPESLRERGDIIDRLGAILEIELTPLDGTEIWQLIELLSTADAKALHATLTALRIGFGESMTARIANRMFIIRPALAVALARLELQPATSLAIVRGLQDTSGASKAILKLPKLDQEDAPEITAISEKAPALMEAHWIAAAALLSQDTAFGLEGVSPARMVAALHQVSGAIGPDGIGIFLFRGHPIITPRGGLSAETLDHFLKDLDESDLAAFGNGSPQQENDEPASAKEILEKSPVANRGFGYLGFFGSQGQLLLRGNRQDRSTFPREPFEFDAIRAIRSRGLSQMSGDKSKSKATFESAPEIVTTQE
ncbi:hypothetical protein [Limibacillus sp. MBR-115]|uniref:hypothetical protein n=1 Tax=Limibacillus sp. MBR-115 TaxID=3156465 RepID=UPI0033938BF8